MSRLCTDSSLGVRESMTLFSTCGEGEGIPIPDTENVGLIELNF